MHTNAHPTATDRRQTKRAAIAASVFVALAMVVVAALPSEAFHGGIEVEPLTGRHQFTDDVSTQIRLKPDGRPRNVLNMQDASNLAVLEITIAPGDRFPWHTHPGPVLAAVTQGDLVYIYADDCVEREYPSGTAFVDPGGDNVHTAYNPSDEQPTVVIATFLDSPDEGPLTIPVAEAQQAELDERCFGAPQ